MTVSGLMDHRPFKAVSTSAAEALTAIGAKRGKDEETTCILGFHQIGPRYASFLWLPNPSLLSVFHITSHGTSIAEAEEGATTDCVRTAAAHSHVLDFLDSSHIGGPHVKGNHLVNSENVQK